MTPPEDLHEWVSFDLDDDDLPCSTSPSSPAPGRASSARGCPGVLTGPAPELEQGCCSYGAHFADKDDRKRDASRYAERLGARRVAVPERVRRRRRARSTRTTTASGSPACVDDACIFLNRPGFRRRRRLRPAPAALARGERSLDWKPDGVLAAAAAARAPLDENEHVTYMLREWKRRDWGEGGAEFHWWCTETPRPSWATEPVYEELRDEIVETGRRSRLSTRSSSRCGTDRRSSFSPILRSRSGPEPPTGSRMRAFTAEELQKASLEEGMIFPEYVLDQLVAAIDAGQARHPHRAPGHREDDARLPGRRGGPPGHVLHRLPADHRHHRVDDLRDHRRPPAHPRRA